jgi:hypothetical protein
LLIFSARGTRLLGGNRGVQKCDSVDPLSLVIKCLGGGGHELGDSKVRTFGKRPLPPGDQVNTHTIDSSLDLCKNFFAVKKSKNSEK